MATMLDSAALEIINWTLTYQCLIFILLFFTTSWTIREFNSFIDILHHNIEVYFNSICILTKLNILVIALCSYIQLESHIFTCCCSSFFFFYTVNISLLYQDYPFVFCFCSDQWYQGLLSWRIFITSSYLKYIFCWV